MKSTPQIPLADLEGRVLALKQTIGRHVYELGQVLAQIKRDTRYKEAGYRGFTRYMVEELDINSSTGFAALAVYRHFSPEIAARYGADKLNAGLAWMHATQVVEEPGDIIAADITLSDGRTKPFHEASARQIREATALLRNSERDRHAPSPELQRGIDTLTASLPEVPARLQRGGRVQFIRYGDKEYLTFRAIPVVALSAYIENLREFVKPLK